MNNSIDLSMLDGIADNDASLILSGTDAPDPFSDHFSDDALDLDPSILWPVNLDLDTTHSTVTELTDSSGSAHESSAAERVGVKPELELFPFEAPPPLSLSASLNAPSAGGSRSAPPAPQPAAQPAFTALQENEPARSNFATSRRAPAKPRAPAPQSAPPQAPAGHAARASTPQPVTAMSADAKFAVKTEVSTLSSGDSASTSSRAGPQSPSARTKEKLAQRKLRNKESARRYREKQVARRRQLENFTRTLAEQNRELEALHDRLLALTCDRRNAAGYAAPPPPPQPPIASLQ